MLQCKIMQLTPRCKLHLDAGAMKSTSKAPSAVPSPVEPESAAVAHPTGDMLTAHLLALLKGWTAYGYELARQLQHAGFGTCNKSTVYRTLRHMEALGMVYSTWDTSANGPARRRYALTAAGDAFLNNWLDLLNAHRVTLERVLSATRLAPTEDPDRT